MKFKLLINSLFYYRNIAALLAFFGIALFVLQSSVGSLTMPWIFGGVLTAYLALVLQSMKSKKFQDAFLHRQKVASIKNLNKVISQLATETKRHTNAAYYKKLCSIIEDKQEIMNLYNKDEPDFLKEKVTEQALNLVVSYIKLLKSFCKRSRELGFVDVAPVMERISQNNRKLNFTNDPAVYEDIKKIIEMDERIISRLKEEKQDLERIDAKLDYIKSTVSMFKHQINTSLESEEMLGKIESVLNEAVALETVLEDRHKKKLRH